MLSAAPLVAILVALSLGEAAAAAAAATPLAPARSARSSQARPSRSAVAADEQRRCHRPTNRRTHRDCAAYATPIANASAYGSLPAACFDVTWRAANRARGNATALGTSGAWGSCVSHTLDDAWRYMTSNSVPDFYFGPYCPLGLGLGYCVGGDDACAFDGLVCGDAASAGASAGFTPYGDVWVPSRAYAKVPRRPDPTRADRPADMYAVVGAGEKNVGALTAFALQNGVSIQGPNDAGDYNIDEAGFVLPCGGHVTPPVDALPAGRDEDASLAVPAAPPQYHTHKAPDCLEAFVRGDETYGDGGRADRHGALFAYALDGFGVHAYADVGGAAPVLDECGGHFGPTADGAGDGDGTVTYHYHATTYTPYHLACQGPALGACASTGTQFCGPGCGAQVCAQPGTDARALAAYVGRFNASWLERYTTNLEPSSAEL